MTINDGKSYNYSKNECQNCCEQTNDTMFIQQEQQYATDYCQLNIHRNIPADD